jgi:hypothetical protein
MHVSGMTGECDYPDDTIKLYVCPECGTVKVELGGGDPESMMSSQTKP